MNAHLPMQDEKIPPSNPLMHSLLNGLQGTHYENKLRSLLNLHPELKDCSSEVLFKSVLEFLKSGSDQDTLTGLLSSVSFEKRMSETIALAKRHANKLVLLTLSISDFRDIRDSLGRRRSDGILQVAAKRLEEVVREEDLLSRDQNDFSLCFNVKKVTDTDVIVEKIKEKFKVPVSVEEKDFILSLKIGASIFPDDGDSVEELIKRSNTAMRRSPGQCHYWFFSDEMQKGARERTQLLKEMSDGLDAEEFVVFYQPKIDLLSGSIIGFEALVRWMHPERGMVSPALFIPAAEESGLIVGIGAVVLKNACEQLKKWHDLGHPHLHMAVNIASQQLQNATIIQLVDDILKTTHMFPDRLELEVTESSAMVDVEETIKLLVALRQRGIQIAVDDFGTGYSSLSYLKRFPITTLKVDQSFVRDLPEDLDSLEIVNAIIAMGRSLGFKLVAEGVETQAQEAVLRTAGCHAVQGFLYSRPVPADQITPLLDKSFR